MATLHMPQTKYMLVIYTEVFLTERAVHINAIFRCFLLSDPSGYWLSSLGVVKNEVQKGIISAKDRTQNLYQ
jgi:hypothetical protein